MIEDAAMEIFSVEELREKLLDYYGTATGCNPMAMMDVIEVQRATSEQLVELAEKLGWTISLF